MNSPSRFVTLVSLVSLCGCAEGDSLFADARAAHSGAYAQRLAAQQQEVDAEQSRTTSLDAQNNELKQQSAPLSVAIEQERRDVAALQAGIKRLDRDIRTRKVATSDAKIERDRLEKQAVDMQGQITALQQQHPSSSADLERYKARKEELTKRLAELTALYQGLL